ncbi:MAG: DUF126 domain-containing protein [Mycobacteriales bacterium]
MGDLTGKVLYGGTASGEVMVLDEALSFWGGIDRQTGAIIDEHHPQRGSSVAGKVLVMPYGRGSSSSTSVFAETIRAGSGPLALLLLEPDVILVLGAMVAGELYDKRCPVVVVPPDDYSRLATGQLVQVVAQMGDTACIQMTDAVPA